jgi:hypothetical protein
LHVLTSIPLAFPFLLFTLFSVFQSSFLHSLALIQDQWEILQDSEKSKSEDKPEKETSTAVEDKTTTNDDNDDVIVDQPGKLFNSSGS